jgi:glucose-1-phosphate adenylyltransferase
VTADNTNWYRGTADAIYQNINFLKNSHEPYVIVASGDGVYKLDFNKVLEYHIEKKADITVVCKDMEEGESLERYGNIITDEDGRIVEYDEKPLQAKSNTVSCGIYVFRRRHLIELLEKSAEEDRYDLVRDILIRYKDARQVYAYRLQDYWKNIASVEDYFKTNMDFLNPEVRNYFFRQHPDIYSKVDDLPPAKYNAGAKIKNSLIASGCIVNGEVENSVIFKKSYIGNNCVIKNSIILNDVYIADNTYIENCIVESHATVNANSTYTEEQGKIRIVVEKNARYTL